MELKNLSKIALENYTLHKQYMHASTKIDYLIMAISGLFLGLVPYLNHVICVSIDVGRSGNWPSGCIMRVDSVR